MTGEGPAVGINSHDEVAVVRLNPVVDRCRTVLADMSSARVIGRTTTGCACPQGQKAAHQAAVRNARGASAVRVSPAIQ